LKVSAINTKLFILKMKMLQLVILFLAFSSCKSFGQEKGMKAAADTISGGFNSVSNYYFDFERNIPCGVYLNSKIGKFTVEYIPRHRKENQHFEKFLIHHNIQLRYDQLNDAKYISASDQIKIDSILREILGKSNLFEKIGSFIASDYINFENDHEYSIALPYKVSYYYQNERGQWIFMKEEVTNTHYVE